MTESIKMKDNITLIDTGLLFAAALENNLTLVTNNTKDYLKISDFFNLKIDNWMR